MIIMFVVPKQNIIIFVITPSVSKYMSILENNFVSQYLSLSSFNATLIIVLSIIPYIFIVERKKRMK